jgi:hypothetical protein
MLENYKMNTDVGVSANIHELAKAMLAAGFVGQNMRNPYNAQGYIVEAAENETIDASLNDVERRFWGAAGSAFRKWKAMRAYKQRNGLPLAPEDQQRKVGEVRPTFDDGVL